MTTHLNYPKPNLVKLFFIELAFLLVGAFAFFVIDNKNPASLASFFLGGLSILLPNIFFAVKFFSFNATQADSGMQKLLAYQAGKFILAIICLAISLYLLIYLQIFTPKYFLGAYIFMLFLHIFFSGKIKYANLKRD